MAAWVLVAERSIEQYNTGHQDTVEINNIYHKVGKVSTVNRKWNRRQRKVR